MTKLLQILRERFFDESSYVRNTILRIFSDIAHYHPEITYGEVVKLLNYPSTVERSKPLAILYEIASHESTYALYKTYLFQSIPILLDMLKLNQTNHHESAYKILKILTGCDYGKGNYQSWHEWGCN